MMKSIFGIVLIFSYFTTNAQLKDSANIILNNIGQLECNTCTNDQYHIYENYTRYQIEYNKISNSLSLTSELYFFPTDKVIKEISNTDFQPTSIKKAVLQNTSSLNKDLYVMNNTFDIILYEKSKVAYANAANINFLSVTKYLLSYYGDSPGQPQEGFLYVKNLDIPTIVKKEIIKLKSKKLISIKVEKSFLYDNQLRKTKNYLIKGDKIEVLKKNANYCKVRFYGNKIIEGWVNNNDITTN